MNNYDCGNKSLNMWGGMHKMYHKYSKPDYSDFVWEEEIPTCVEDMVDEDLKGFVFNRLVAICEYFNDIHQVDLVKVLENTNNFKFKDGILEKIYLVSGNQELYYCNDKLFMSIKYPTLRREGHLIEKYWKYWEY